MAREAWKDIPGFEGCYQASSLGRVRSVDRYDNLGKKWKGRVLQSSDNGSGYLAVSLSMSGKPRTKRVHSLVAMTFLGPCPEGMEVCHDDGDQKNCAPGNLRYDTPAGNHKDKIRHGTLLKGDQHANAKLKADQVLEIRGLKGKSSTREIARRFGISASTARDILARRIWAHLPESKEVGNGVA